MHVSNLQVSIAFVR